jgi:Putative MetA-pathway of phenol degradation
MPAVVLAWITVVAAGEAGAGRPLDTEDTGTLDPGRVEVELSGAYARDRADAEGALKGVLTVGLLPRLEARIESSYLVTDPGDEIGADGVGDSLLGAKYRLLSESGAAPAVLIGWTLRLPTGDEARGLGEPGVDLGVLAVVSKTFGPVTLTANGGYTFVTADRGLDAWILAGSIEYRVTKRWWGVGEILGELGMDRRPHGGVARVGSAYAVSDRVRLDGAVGVGLTRHDPDVVVTVGVTVLFPWRP